MGHSEGSSEGLQTTFMDKDAMFQHEIDKEVKFMMHRNNKDLDTIKETLTESTDYKMTYLQPLYRNTSGCQISSSYQTSSAQDINITEQDSVVE